MNDLRAPDCKVFVDAEVSDRELFSMIAQSMFIPDDPTPLEVEVIKNEEYDSNRRRLFPDGFVHFRYILDVYMNRAPRDAKVAAVSRLLDFLWSWGYPAVAAAPFEDRLPERGGYKSRRVPWAE